jgi:hypothetical protein
VKPLLKKIKVKLVMVEWWTIDYRKDKQQTEEVKIIK